MDKTIEQKIRDYAAKAGKSEAIHKRVEALKSYYRRNDLGGLGISMMDAFKCVFEAVQGNENEVGKVIDQLTASMKRKVRGRTQVYGSNNVPDIYIKKDENGRISLVGYNTEKEAEPKGQAVTRNPNIFRKSDGQIRKDVQKTEEKVMDLGKQVRELYPNEDGEYIALAMRAIREYAQQHKINTDKVIKGLTKGRLVYDTDVNRIKPNVTESRVIVISEDTMSEIREDSRMDEYKFRVNVKKFLAQLLDDSVNAQPSELLRMHGLTRSRLINYLIGSGILEKREKICDKDEFGNPKTATMKVSFNLLKTNGEKKGEYSVPKPKLDRKLNRLYIRLFERNVPERKTIVNEDGEGATSCAAMGDSPVMPMFGVQRRKIAETATTDAGDYTYDVPFAGDDETLARHNGKGGSVSINIEEDDERESLTESRVNFDVGQTNNIEVDRIDRPDDDELEELRIEDGCDDHDISEYIHDNTTYTLICYDSDYHHIGYFEGDIDDISYEFGDDIAEKIKNAEEGERITDILDYASDNVDTDNVEQVNAMAKKMFPNGGFSEYLLTDGDTVGMTDHVYISRIGGMTKAKMMSLGNIRLGGSEYGSIGIMKMPTSGQIYGLKQYLRQNHRAVEVNFCQYRDGDREPHVIHTVSYDGDANVDRIANDIYYFYKDGIRP